MSLKELSDTIKAKSECDIQRIKERARFDYTLAKLFPTLFIRRGISPILKRFTQLRKSGEIPLRTGSLSRLRCRLQPDPTTKGKVIRIGDRRIKDSYFGAEQRPDRKDQTV